MLENKNLAYDLSLFEEVKKSKKAQIIGFPNKNNAQMQKRKISASFVTKMVVSTVLCCAVFGTIVYGNLRLNEIISQISLAEKSLREATSSANSINLKDTSELSPATLKIKAQELGMGPTSPSNIEYIKLN